MIISLYRRGSDLRREVRLVYERGGLVFVQETLVCPDRDFGALNSRVVGAVGLPETDRALVCSLNELVGLGFRVLYSFVPSGVLPETRRFLSDSLGVETIPDVSDGIPIWRGRERRMSYLLFTALSSETK